MCYTFKLVNVKSELLPMIIDYNDISQEGLFKLTFGRISEKLDSRPKKLFLCKGNISRKYEPNWAKDTIETRCFLIFRESGTPDLNFY